MSFEWIELEALSGKISGLEGRITAARSSKNYGLVRVLEEQIAGARERRDRLLNSITTQMTNSPESARAADLSGSITSEIEAPAADNQLARVEQIERVGSLADIRTTPPGHKKVSRGKHIEHNEKRNGISAPTIFVRISDTGENDTRLWKVKLGDIERAIDELKRLRAETLVRHGAEISALELDKTEIEALERAIDTFARRRWPSE